MDYDTWKLSNPQDNEEVFCKCEHCEYEIYKGEHCLEINNLYVHYDCFEDFAWEYIQPERVIAGE